MPFRMLVILLVLGIGTSTVERVQAQSAPSAASPVKRPLAPPATPYVEEMKAAEGAFAERHFLSARDAFARANAQRRDTSAEAWFGMARASAALKFRADAAKELDRALEYVGTNTKLEAAIRYQRGQVLIPSATGPDDPRLEQAASDMGRARSLDPALTSAGYYRGLALLASYHDVDGLSELKAFLAGAPDSVEAVRARALVATPRKARERWEAPAFSIQTADGKTLTSADLRGTVVLLDFWGSWCAPCRAHTKGLVEVSRTFAGKPFSFIGVALLERDRDLWQAYVAEHGMTWTQAMYPNFDAPISKAFRLDGVPGYIVIDADGIVRGRPGDPVEIEKAVRTSLATIGA
jgi:thiol-disulfide isomerase/thioredoxin